MLRKITIYNHHHHDFPIGFSHWFFRTQKGHGNPPFRGSSMSGNAFALRSRGDAKRMVDDHVSWRGKKLRESRNKRALLDVLMIFWTVLWLFLDDMLDHFLDVLMIFWTIFLMFWWYLEQKIPTLDGPIHQLWSQPLKREAKPSSWSLVGPSYSPFRWKIRDFDQSPHVF